MQGFLQWFLVPFVEAVVIILVLLLCVAYITLLERKVIAFMQVRIGPNRVGPRGLLQPIADVVKLLIKEDITPNRANPIVFYFAPVIATFSAIAALAVIPFGGPGAVIDIFGFKLTPYVADVNVGLLYVLSISSIGVFGIVLGGWASNSKYPMLGGLRSAAQMISYEVPFGLAIIGALMIVGSSSMVAIVEWQRAHTWLFWLQPFAVVLFYVAGLAENNRAPFDLPEAETELVAGFHTEYSGMRFAFFFLAEYISMIVVAGLVVTIFFGGYLPITLGLGYIFKDLPALLGGSWGGAAGQMLMGIVWFAIKVFFVLYVYLWVRATFPRYRYDQLMNIGWLYMIPASLVWILITGAAVLVFQRFAA